MFFVTLNNLIINSPDNGYSTEQSSSEPSPPITNTVQQQLPPPPPLAAPPAQTVTVSTPPPIYELSPLRPVNQSNLSNAYNIKIANIIFN